MTKLTLIIGGVLVAAGVIAYAVTGAASVTALIPSFIGLALLGCAGLARRPRLFGLGLGAAMVIALLGAAGSLPNVAGLPELFDGTAEQPEAVVTSTIMFVLLLGYLVAGTRFLVLGRAPARASS